MFAGEITAFLGDADSPETDKPVLIEVTECDSGPYIEITTNLDEYRVYLRFRLSDLQREIKEMRAQ